MDPAELDRILMGLPNIPDANVLVGFSHKDDAAVYKLPSGELLVQTVDFFTPIVDDPYDYGSIAAANSLSDIYAMNGKPLFALNICCFPRKVGADVWHEVLRGGAEKAIEAGIPIIGGHTVDDAEPKYGMVVTGLVPADRYWANEGAKVGDALILTKPLGTGIITTALKAETLSYAEAADAVEAMKTLNSKAAAVLARFDVHACTDITGNGFLGHSIEIAEASRVGLEFDLATIPLYKAAAQLSESGKFPGGTFSNQRYFGPSVDVAEGVSDVLLWLLFDAQTSGGLLAALPADQSTKAVEELQAAGIAAATVVGRVIQEPRIRILP